MVGSDKVNQVDGRCYFFIKALNQQTKSRCVSANFGVGGRGGSRVED